jgi:hypothetical protein
MVAFYARMISAERITLEQVPVYWRTQVEAAMAG